MCGYPAGRSRAQQTRTRDLIKWHPLTPELATKLFTSKGMGVFRFSAALIEWSESQLNDVKRLCVQAYKNAWHLPRSTASALFIFPKTHAGKKSTLPMAVLTQELLLHAERCMRHEDHCFWQALWVHCTEMHTYRTPPTPCQSLTTTKTLCTHLVWRPKKSQRRVCMTGNRIQDFQVTRLMSVNCAERTLDFHGPCSFVGIKGQSF